jgi:hypothetical protein
LGPRLISIEQRTCHAREVRGLVAVVVAGCGRIGFEADPTPVDGPPADGQLLPWQTETSLVQPREQLGLVAHNGFLYATGGDDGVADSGTSFTMFAPIAPDGSLGPWTLDSDSQTMDCRYRHTSPVVSDHLFVIGGNCGGNPQSDAFRAPVLSDGSLGAFGASMPMPVGRRRHTTWVVNDYVFIVGGSNPGFNTVYSAHIEPDGSILAWTLDPEPLPGNRFWHGSALWNGHAYVIGGLDEAGTRTDTVFFARVNDDGTTGPWQTSPNTLPTPLIQHVSFAANGYLYVVGGQTSDGSVTTLVRFAEISPDGSTGPWNDANEALPEPRMFHALAMTSTHIYIAGGDADNAFGGAVDTVYSVRIR